MNMSRNSEGYFQAPDHPDFMPHYNPVEMFKMGIFGGSYFGLYFDMKGDNPENQLKYESYISDNRWIDNIDESILPSRFFLDFFNKDTIEDIKKIPNFSRSIGKSGPVGVFEPTDLFNADYNYYKVKAGLDYEWWYKKGLIHEDDPHGWVEWYIKFFYGRRHFDDDRQIKRWKSFTARQGGMFWSLCKKYNKDSISSSTYPKLRQGLLQWSFNPLLKT